MAARLALENSQASRRAPHVYLEVYADIPGFCTALTSGPSPQVTDSTLGCPSFQSSHTHFIFVQTEGGADILGISPTGVFQNEAGPDNAANSPKGPVRFAEEDVQSSAEATRRGFHLGGAADGGTGFLYELERVHNGVHNKR